MKLRISIELFQEDRPVTPKDLTGWGTKRFLEVAPKALKRACKGVCWPFDAKVQVELIEEEVVLDDKPKTKKKEKKRAAKKAATKGGQKGH